MGSGYVPVRETERAGDGGPLTRAWPERARLHRIRERHDDARTERDVDLLVDRIREDHAGLRGLEWRRRIAARREGEREHTKAPR